MLPMRTACLALLAGVLWLAPVTSAGSYTLRATDRVDLPATLLRGWSALRAMDCARCHGRDFDGSSGPDLVAAVRDGSRERFDRIVLEGEIQRGMPGYRSQALVVIEIDAIYAYLRARADGLTATGRPALGVLP